MLIALLIVARYFGPFTWSPSNARGKLRDGTGARIARADLRGDVGRSQASKARARAGPGSSLDFVDTHSSTRLPARSQPASDRTVLSVGVGDCSSGHSDAAGGAMRRRSESSVHG